MLECACMQGALCVYYAYVDVWVSVCVHLVSWQPANTWGIQTVWRSDAVRPEPPASSATSGAESSRETQVAAGKETQKVCSSLFSRLLEKPLCLCTLLHSLTSLLSHPIYLQPTSIPLLFSALEAKKSPVLSRFSSSSLFPTIKPLLRLSLLKHQHTGKFIVI